MNAGPRLTPKKADRKAEGIERFSRPGHGCLPQASLGSRLTGARSGRVQRQHFPVLFRLLDGSTQTFRAPDLVPGYLEQPVA